MHGSQINYVNEVSAFSWKLYTFAVYGWGSSFVMVMDDSARDTKHAKFLTMCSSYQLSSTVTDILSNVIHLDSHRLTCRRFVMVSVFPR